MTTEMILILAQSFATLVYITLAAMLLLPKVPQMPLRTVVALLLIPHAFRFIALEIYSAIQNGTVGGTVDVYAMLIWGDVLTAVLAILALWALILNWSSAKMIVWVTIVFGVLDQIFAAGAVLSSRVGGSISDLTWFSFAFFVPLLWVASALLLWQLWVRRHEDFSARA